MFIDMFCRPKSDDNFSSDNLMANNKLFFHILVVINTVCRYCRVYKLEIFKAFLKRKSN